MEEKRYLISDAAKTAQVEPHVLRYWEEELKLPIQRTELGHRYYTEEDIQTFQNIKELKEINEEFEKSFDLEYRDVVFTKDNFIIYNEAECIITSFQGKEKYAGEITEQTLLLKPLGGKRYLAVTKESLDIIELN